MNRPPLCGVTVMPEYFQTESVEPLLDGLLACGVNAISTSPYVMAEADPQTGQREPPADAGAGKVRLLDRPLWGKQELWVRTAPSFLPQAALYDGLAYQPAPADALTKQQDALIEQVIAAAQERQMAVFLQVQAAIPPGYRVQFGGPREDDQPRLPDGRAVTNRVANNGSLASPQILAYQQALLRELCRVYPQIDGIRVDWPEYPPYELDSIFLDFGVHAEQAATRLGLPFAEMRRDAQQLYDWLHGGLTAADLAACTADPESWPARLAVRFPALGDWLAFKNTLVEELLSGFRSTLEEESGGTIRLWATSFPPPWSLLSGLDPACAARHVDTLSVKLYGMHWSMILRNYAEQLLAANPTLPASALVAALFRLLDVGTGPASGKLSEVRYPDPEEPHLGSHEVHLRKIQQAQDAAGPCPVIPLAHSYGPLDDFRRRLEAARDAGPHGFWINRYGYLSDAKLAVLAELATS